MSAAPKNSPVLKRSDPLFEKKVPTQGFTHADEIMIRVLTGHRNVGQLVEDVIHVEVTDLKDPFIFYYIDICETNLTILREQHNINAPMAKMSDVIIQLLDRCLMGGIVNLALSPIPVTYFTRLNRTTDVFTVMEKNHYNSDVVHFSLPMVKGDDKDVQEYLASRLDLSLSVAGQQASKILHLEANLDQELEQKEKALYELQLLRSQSDNQKQTSESEHTRELSRMRMECAQQMEELRQRFEEEKTMLRAEITDMVARLHSERDATGLERNRLQKEALDADATIRELDRKLTSEVAARERMEIEWTGTQAKKGEIETQFVRVQGEKAQREAEIKLLKEQLANKTESVATQMKLVENSETANRKVEERLAEVQAALAATNQSLRASQDQCAEHLASLARQEEKIAKCLDKLKMKDETLRRQEQARVALEEKGHAEHNAMVQARESEKTTQLTLNQTKYSLEQALAQLEEANSQIANDKNTIAYLHEQINQNQLTGGYAPAPVATHSSLSHSPYSTSGAHAVTPSAQRAYSAPRSANTFASELSATPNAAYSTYAAYDYPSLGAGAGAGVSPDTFRTAPYASASRPAASVHTHTTDYVRASYNKATPTSANAEDVLRNVQSLGLGGEFSGDFVQKMMQRDASGILEESSSSSSSGGRYNYSSGAGGASRGSVGGVGSGTKNTTTTHTSYKGASAVVEDINFDDLQYYSLPAPTTTTIDSKRGSNAASTGASPPHKSSRLPVRGGGAGTGAGAGATTKTTPSSGQYDWQRPDFK